MTGRPGEQSSLLERMKGSFAFPFEDTASALHRAGLTPNFVSFLSLLSSLSSAVSFLYLRDPYFLPPVLLLLLD